MKKFFINGPLLSIASFLLLTACKTPEKIQIASVDIDAIINVQEVKRIERTLAADEMRGRKIFTPDIDKAADFIAAEFKAIGLQTWNNSGNYRQEFTLAPADLTNYGIETVDEITEHKLANVVGVLPGKSKKDEYVIFSSHYDHLGVGKPVNGDSIYNGANDDAAGTTAVIMLAKHFNELKNNERTIVFVAFTAEEVGGFGSQYFSRQIDANKVMAMFNIEMIGTESKWGKNSAYITGYEKTNMGEILARDLKGTGFTFYPDPYPQQQLFYRSDNATLARLGVPAHTISTSKMDVEPHYHQMSDNVETLDMENMTMIIKAIALSSKSIIAGKETPTRVKVEELR
jgi:Zn-dependent M28 family amino/carboxypeptidase